MTVRLQVYVDWHRWILFRFLSRKAHDSHLFQLLFPKIPWNGQRGCFPVDQRNSSAVLLGVRRSALTFLTARVPWPNSRETRDIRIGVPLAAVDFAGYESCMDPRLFDMHVVTCSGQMWKVYCTGEHVAI